MLMLTMRDTTFFFEDYIPYHPLSLTQWEGGAQTQWDSTFVSCGTFGAPLLFRVCDLLSCAVVHALLMPLGRVMVT